MRAFRGKLSSSDQRRKKKKRRRRRKGVPQPAAGILEFG
jgi:hypothetical protein